MVRNMSWRFEDASVHDHDRLCGQTEFTVAGTAFSRSMITILFFSFGFQSFVILRLVLGSTIMIECGATSLSFTRILSAPMPDFVACESGIIRNDCSSTSSKVVHRGIGNGRVCSIWSKLPQVLSATAFFSAYEAYWLLVISTNLSNRSIQYPRSFPSSFWFENV